jgi:MFS transporter, PAT family, beta-lactamase induction signal transducer AmpG
VFETKTLRYSMYALLYFAQGAILSYFTALNALYLLSFDLSMSQVGIFGAIALTPFVLKIGMGMISDRFNLLGHGHRKPYIVIGLLVQAGCLIIVPLIHPGLYFWLLAAVAFVLMSGMALYDTCTDGLALDTTAAADVGSVQGIMIGGRAMGVVVVSAALGLLAQLTNWTVAFWVLAAITLLPLPLVLRLREPQRPPEKAFQWQAFRAFRQGPIVALALLGILYSLMTYGANEIVNPFLQQEFGIDYFAAGLYTAAWGLGVVLGSLTGGRFTDRIGHRQALLLATAASFFSILALSAIGSAAMAWPIVFVFGLAFGYYDTVYISLCMGFCDPRIAASMFAILMALTNVGTGVGFALTGSMADSLGYRTTFVVVALLSLAVLPFISPIFRGRRAVSGEPVA